MIIGYDASRAFSEKPTGTENYAFQILRHLAIIDHTNNYHIFVRQNPRITAKDWPSNFKFIIIPYPRLWTQFGLAKQTFTDKLDVLFVPSHTLPIIRKPGLKTVITVHDLGAKYLPKMHQLKQQLYLKFMTDVQLKTASHIIAVSKATKDDIIYNLQIHPDKISVVYEGYNEKLFKPNKVKPLPYPYFLFVGTIQPRKNLERLIKAYAQGPRTLPHLVLAGSKGWMSEEIYELPKKLGIEKYVKFLGYVPDEKLPALYSGAEALLFPSLFEGFGLPILEAFSCGCPVLTSKVSSMPEVTRVSDVIPSAVEGSHYAAILVDPYSIDAIAEGIKQIMDQKVKEKLVKEGFKQAKKFSWQKAAQETLQVITSN